MTISPISFPIRRLFLPVFIGIGLFASKSYGDQVQLTAPIPLPVTCVSGCSGGGGGSGGSVYISSGNITNTVNVVSTSTIVTAVTASSTTNNVTAYQGTTPWISSGAVTSVTASSTTNRATVYFDGTSTAPVTVTNSITGVFSSTSSTTGGATYFHFISTAGANGFAVNIKASAGTLYSFCCVNSSATIAYTKAVDKASLPVEGTDTPALSFGVPANSTTGAGICYTVPQNGIAFLNGISFMVTANGPDADKTAVSANQVICSGGYK